MRLPPDPVEERRGRVQNRPPRFYQLLRGLEVVRYVACVS